ncbi:type IV pilin-like G/H family protein [Chroococcus sp. FPU101]|uniref:type IV pilin-like G/H family protein n=1 Tax=Chroococcus sp. FPU101 TaxID=1974212 RepID=UPI001A8F28A4|nr:type IV pilin-like G/H family protein [Chroococcus sp. FPU101]GFE68462.1 pilin polypeptide PilA [Chroococcus sp. FPU101]
MNTYFTAQFLQNLVRKKENKGFTLIELLVVVIIVGVLAAIAMPSLLGQVVKGRHAEARAMLGALNRAQMAYRYEKAIFTKIQDLPIVVPAPGLYYSFVDDGTPDTFHGAQKAVALPAYDNDINNHASAAGQTASGGYTAVLCEDEEPTQDDVTTTHTSGVVSCVNGISLK